MLEKLDNDVFSKDDVDPDDRNSDITTFLSEDMGLVTVDLNNINLDENNFNDDDRINIIHARLIVWFD